MPSQTKTTTDTTTADAIASTDTTPIVLASIVTIMAAASVPIPVTRGHPAPCPIQRRNARVAAVTTQLFFGCRRPRPRPRDLGAASLAVCADFQLFIGARPFGFAFAVAPAALLLAFFAERGASSSPPLS